MDGEEARALVRIFQFQRHDIVPRNIYPNVAPPFLAVGAQWVTRAQMGIDLVHEITRARWLPQTGRLLEVDHAKGASVRLDTALAGMVLLRNSRLRLACPLPHRGHVIRTISAVPRALKRFMGAMRMWISTVWRSGSLAMMRSPKDFRQRSLASIQRRAW